MSSPASLAFRAVLQGGRTAALEPLTTRAWTDSGRLRLNVLFTSYPETLGALKSAGALTAELPAEILLFVPFVVPFPLPLEEPPVPLTFVCRRISELVSHAPEGTRLEAYVFLCRNPIETILDVLKPRSLVLIGARAHGFFTRSQRFARKLRSAGHEVLLTGCA